MSVVSVDVKPINSLFRVYSRCSDTWSLLMAPPPRKATAGPSMTMDDKTPAQWTLNTATWHTTRPQQSSLLALLYIVTY